ncbi:MAG: GrpE, partial [Planctomycetota bacterium]
HEAVMKQPVQGVAPGAISMAFQSGYRLGDSVLRPAKVAVQPTE